ncbi:hypothetical protein P3554_23270, partial [Vibrio parahaemolyticus]|nr:hypothetical protein [Vibrio parahaemolyticus]
LMCHNIPDSLRNRLGLQPDNGGFFASVEKNISHFLPSANMNLPRCDFAPTLGVNLSLDLGAFLSLQQTIEQTIEQKAFFHFLFFFLR